jgi:predicted HTH domain antitoxin
MEQLQTYTEGLTSFGRFFPGNSVHMKTVKAVYVDGVFRPTGDVDLPDSCEVEFEPRLLGENDRQLESAIEKFVQQKVSLGKAAQLAGMTRWTFKEVLADRGIAVEVEVPAQDRLDQMVDEIASRRR